MESKMITFTDANNKDITVEEDKILNFTTDMADSASSTSDYIKMLPKSKIPKVQYVTEDGESFDPLQTIADMKSGNSDIIAVDVNVEATHSGNNFNYATYYSDSMENDAQSFVNPFSKPVLKNHNSYNGEPLGRVKDFYVGPSEIVEDRDAIKLGFRAYDQDAMIKFLDGRYKTVSVSGTMGHVTCQICGKPILKDGEFKFCGHWRGETYKGKKCYWGIRDIRYNEVSVVNSPADQYAIITKVTAITKNSSTAADSQTEGTSDAAKKEDFKDMSKKKLTKEERMKLFDSFMNELETDKDGETKDSEDKPKDDKTDDGKTSDSEKEQDNDDVNKKLADTEKELKEAKDQLDALQSKLDDSEKKLKEALEDAEDLKERNDMLQDSCTTMSVTSKEILADFIIKIEGISDEEATERRKELMAKSMKELSATDFEKKEKRTPAKVNSPALTTDSEDGKEDDDKGSNSRKKTTDSYKNSDSVASIINSITSR